MMEKDEALPEADSMRIMKEGKENVSVSTKQEEEDDDPVLSCYWSDWTEWSVCGKDSLKQRTRLCVGLKVHYTSTSLNFHQNPREVLRKRVDKMFTSEIDKADLAASEEVLLQPTLLGIKVLWMQYQQLVWIGPNLTKLSLKKKLMVIPNSKKQKMPKVVIGTTGRCGLNVRHSNVARRVKEEDTELVPAVVSEGTVANTTGTVTSSCSSFGSCVWMMAQVLSSHAV
uniref:Uncharacterized protein n=1 Tax=Ditylenchus dipsaci TaxID=166011 RepID=A0A915D810_9BILA